MKNLLRVDISETELREIIQQCPPRGILPSETDPSWQNAAQKRAIRESVTAIQKQALLEAEAPMPVLTDPLYADFAQTGIRINFEKLYFERRRQLGRAAIATLTESDAALKEKFRASLHRKAADIFAEESWALPAHVSESTGKNPMMIDLFAAETANTFAELLTVFRGHLTPALTAQIQNRLRTQFFENYLANDFRWLTMTNNWNAVCHQGVLGAALAIEEDADLLAKMLLKMRKNLPAFLEGYSPDGATAEGPGYWSYGFGWYAELNAQLEARTQGQLSICHNDPLIANIARFGPAVALTNSKLVNFSDSASSGGLRPSLIQYLADRLHDPVLQQSAQYFWREQQSSAEKIHGQRTDFFNLSRLLIRCPDTEPTAGDLPTADAYFPGVGWIITRSKSDRGHLLEFAAKAGHNEEHHNHNDVASYLLNINGERILLEIGAPEYVKSFFRADTRYDFLAARSIGHSVPLINNLEQPVGQEFSGAVIEHSTNAKEAIFAVDFTNAYPPEARLTRGTRRFLLDKRAGILRIRDDFDLQSATPVETAIITGPDAILHDGRVIITAGNIRVRIVPEEGTLVRELKRMQYKTHDGSPAYITRIALAPDELAEEISLGYAVEILD